MFPDKELSRFTHVVKVSDDVVALWNSVWLRVIFVTNPLAKYTKTWKVGTTVENLLDRVPKRLLKDFLTLLPILEDERFVVERGEDVSKLQEVRDTTDSLPIAIMYLILTGSCNLKCPGCYLWEMVHGRNVGSFGKLMTKETVVNALDLFKVILEKNEATNPEIVLYGGEPLLNKECLYLAITYAKQIIPDCSITLNTNATLMTNEIAELLGKYDVGVAVSIDGPKQIHDYNRPDTLGNGSFDRALKGFRILQDHSVRTSISCTMLPSNVDSIVDITRWLIEDLGVTSLDLNLFLGSFPDTKSLDRYGKTASKALIESYKISRGFGVHLDRMARKLDPFIEGRLVFNGCGACGQQVVVTPDASIGTCQAGMNNDQYFVHTKGNLFDPTNHKIWVEWRRRSPFNIASCLNCEVLGICGGGCPYNAALNSGSLMGLDEAHCVFARAALKFFLRELWEETKE